MDWGDVRVFLAVAREGSMRAAGRALGLSQPTIARRLAAFEASFGGQTLLDRLPEGLRLNAAGEQLVAAAESVEDAVLTLERRRAAASPVLSGTVRVSTGECAAGFLARCLSGPTTRALPSGITLELVDSRQTANLARREADMALRHQPPETGDFYISMAGTFACAVYRRRGGAWVTYTEEQAHMNPHAGCSGRSERRNSRWHCAPHRCLCIWKRSAPVPGAACCPAMSATAIPCSSG
jgi:DNA-binding transcriptional LysR family regulator